MIETETKLQLRPPEQVMRLARLGASALSSLKQWTFNPARDRGKAAASTVVVPVVFGAGSLPSVAPLRNALDPIRVSPGPG